MASRLLSRVFEPRSNQLHTVSGHLHVRAGLPPAARPPAPLREWLSCGLLTGGVVSLVDAVLMQRRWGLFTGGFLSVNEVDGLGERLSFALVSLMSDAAIAGLFAFVAYALARRLHLRDAAARVLAACTALAPFLVANFLSYELYRYLGDAFDLALMYELTGRSTGEILAVSSSHLVAPVSATLLAVAGVGVLTAVVQRLAQGPRSAVRIRAWIPAALVFTVGCAHVGARVTSESLDNALRRKVSGNIFGWVAGAVTDVDRDGYGLLTRPRDSAPLDGRIYPYAVEEPGNGVDENGVGGDLPVGVTYHEGPGSLRWQQRPSVILVVLESFRADALGARLNGRPVTPVLDRLAAEGVSSSRAYSHNGYTAQSRFHLLTGSLVGRRGGTSLIDDFKANGYDVGYFSGQDDSFGGPEFAVGLERADVSFDARNARQSRYSTFSTAGSLAVPAAVVEERIAEYLKARDRVRPLFLYVNLHDTHFPYHHDGMQPLVGDVVLPPSEITPARRRDVRDMYLNTAANVDRAIGRIEAAVTAHLGSAPGVIVTADHGESLFDEGFLGHGYALNDVQTRIPLVVARLPLQIPEPFGQADLRDAIGKALERPPNEQRGPVITRNTSDGVFQYIGLIHRPRRIAMLGNQGQVLADLRERASGPEDPSRLALVHKWEAMMIARSAGAGR